MVIETARKLGREVGKTKEFRNYRKAKRALEKDKELLRTIGQLEERKRTIEEKLSKLEPIEVSEKREIKELEEKLAASKVFSDYVRAQNDYLELMRKVDAAITEGMEEKSESRKSKE